MVGNKHKNGIMCTFPDCNKTMRTQKFKIHFSKKHLKDGEVYTLEHRRQYEVAREDNFHTVAKHELVATSASAAEVAALSSVVSTTTVEEVPHAENASVVSAAAAAHEVLQTQAKELALLQSQQAQLASHDVVSDVKTEETATSNAESSASDQNSIMALTSMQTPLPARSAETRGSKRPASAMEGEIDPTSALLMQFMSLMDQRFQELVGKMGEMIDVQKDLIDTLQATNPNGEAPGSAFSSAVEAVMKRRKIEMNPRGESGEGNENAEANGEQSPDSKSFVM